jgi:hypothetical protein
MTLTASTGIFSGSFVIPGAPSRTALFYGALIPNLNQGVGFFLLPEPAAPPLTSVTTSPIWSGGLFFQAQ